jgi:hypothetical protein
MELSLQLLEVDSCHDPEVTLGAILALFFLFSQISSPEN